MDEKKVFNDINSLLVNSLLVGGTLIRNQLKALELNKVFLSLLYQLYG